MKVRVAKKGDVKTWQNAKGEGKLMNLEIVDSNGDKMQATLFRDQVDELGD